MKTLNAYHMTSYGIAFCLQMRLSIECISSLIISQLHKFIAFEVVSQTILMAYEIIGCSFETTANLSTMQIFMQITLESTLQKIEKKNTFEMRETVMC